MKNKKGFTLIEILVVVLIIGILAAIAIPQYRMAVTKSKVASILPIMRRWKDALMEYKLQHGSYSAGAVGSGFPDMNTLGVNFPDDWECDGSAECWNDYWDCFLNNPADVSCSHQIDDNNTFYIFMHQPDNGTNTAGMITCEPEGTEGEKICKALGGKLVENAIGYGDYGVYQL